MQHMEHIGNPALLAQVQKAQLSENPKVKGYPNITHSDLDMIMLCLETNTIMAYGSREAKDLLNDIRNT